MQALHFHTCRFVSESHMIHLAYLQHYRLVVGQRRLRSRLELLFFVVLFYFDGNFLGGRAALEEKKKKKSALMFRLHLQR